MDPAPLFDVETALRHELGHVIGLSHSDDNAANMYPSYQYASCDLGDDDKEGITYLYDSSIGGSVSGIVTEVLTP